MCSNILLQSGLIWQRSFTNALGAPFHHTQKLTLQIYAQPAQEFNLPSRGKGYVHEIEEVANCLHNGQTQSQKYPHAASLALSQTLDNVREKIGLIY
jgi:hypothetical protein